MSDYDWECYLAQDQIFHQIMFNGTTAWQQVFSYNPTRRRLILPTATATGTEYAFSDTAPSGFGIVIPTQTSSLILTFRDLGDIVTFPLWMTCLTAAQNNLIITEISVNPDRWSRYQRYINAQLAKLGAL